MPAFNLLIVTLDGEQKIHRPVDTELPEFRVGEYVQLSAPGSTHLNIKGTVKSVEVKGDALHVHLTKA